MIVPSSLFRFEVLATDGAARSGVFSTPHGVVETPAFMPVGTLGAVKTLSPREVAEVGASMILANTYHVYLRPGHKVVGDLGGLHRRRALPGSPAGHLGEDGHRVVRVPALEAAAGT